MDSLDYKGTADDYFDHLDNKDDSDDEIGTMDDNPFLDDNSALLGINPDQLKTNELMTSYYDDDDSFYDERD